ncbi:hypothetical protein FJT64_004957 [Amphibalanus amphitrite]|uniref:Uncharacterized protein n=1 Tax=Amphibalanus amphitrite TaxID=1232801 RepID=A0A6A4VN80_AMPAM|nr:hypothetical protein FJT64_004957 [Amphibalanus amphitrite]
MVITNDVTGGQEKVTSGPAELDVDTALKDKSRRQVAPLWSRARLLAATRADPVYRRSDIEDAVGAVEPEPWWAPPPIDQRRRRQLFEALRDAAEGRSPSAECAAEQAVRAVLYRKHPELRVQRVCQPPDGQFGDIDAEGFIHRGTMPVRVYDDLFLAPANLSRQEIVSMIRAGQYQRGHNVACFYAYLYSYEFVFFCEYLRRIECHTPQAMAVVRGVLQRAEHMHLISHSATIFSLAPEAMFTQRSPFLYLARLFPMQEQWEADLLCDMVNCHDLVKAATAAWKRGEHALFTIHQDMRQQARDRGGPEPPFHPAVVQRPCSAAAFSNIEGEQVQRLDSHGLVVFQESGASFSDVGACCRFSPLGEVSAEEVLRRSVGRHALIRLYDDVFFLGAPPVDLYRKQIRYLRPAEVRLHVQVGFYFDSPGYADFLWRAQRRLARSLADGCRTHAPQLSGAESELVRWLLHEFANTSRRALHDSVRDLARFGPYLLNEYGKTLWRVLGEYLVDKGTLQLCTGLTEHARATLEAALAEHGCLQDN